MADSRLSYSEPPFWVSLDCPSRGALRQPEGTICYLYHGHSASCSVTAILILWMTILHVGALRMQSMSHSVAKEVVDMPGLKSVRLLCEQGWEHHSPLLSITLVSHRTDLTIHLSKGIRTGVIPSSSLYCKFNTHFFSPRRRGSGGRNCIQ